MSEIILLVDDDNALRSVLKRALCRRGFHVLEVNNVEEAVLTATKNKTIDKAIVDLKMDGASGLTLIPQLKQLHPQINIVMLTGYSSVATAVEAVKLGAINYLCKPANTEEILAAFDTQQGTTDTVIPANPPSVERLEWEHIQKILKENNDNVSATARALGMHRRTLQRKLQKRPVKH
jgi:two-component system response regulator RegA